MFFIIFFYFGISQIAFMKTYLIPIMILFLSAVSTAGAQEANAFGKFARTKDSLMHIAFYDNDMSLYKKRMTEFVTGYNKLSAKDKEAYADQVKEEIYFLAKACARAGNKTEALNTLERSKYYDERDLADDTLWNSLRNEARFKRYVVLARSQPTQYRTILQTADAYRASEKTLVPEFTYQNKDEPHLTALRERYDLDSVAGHGTDVSQIINLMEWVHYLIPHNGNKPNPDTKNAMSMIKECRRDGKTLNCRGLGIALNEVYLAMGFKSRYVTCLPKDTADQDCHVITMVWAPSLRKWIWMDPTFMAYVMNEDGELLGIEEVRERLVHGKPLILNPDANHNRDEIQTKSEYLDYYMAKNLYKLECAVSSEYDYETPGEGKTRAYVQLVPGNVTSMPVISRNKQGQVSSVLYQTGDTKAFWAAPAGAMSIPTEGPSHSREDFEAVMKKWKKYYNANQANELESYYNPKIYKDYWTNDNIKSSKKGWGNLISFTYMGLEADNKYEDVALFKVVFENSVHCMAFSLNSDGLINTFRPMTYSPYIDWRLAKAIEEDRSK